MMSVKLKILAAVAFVLALLTSGALLLPSSAHEDPAASGPRAKAAPEPTAFAEQPKEKAGKKKPRCILLWMSGGPSQIDTFDPKAGDIALFKAIDTKIKGMQFSETLPLLAKQAQHLAVLRSAGLVEEQREGRFVKYEVDPQGLAQIGQWLARYRAYWPRRIDDLRALLKEMDQ